MALVFSSHWLISTQEIVILPLLSLSLFFFLGGHILIIFIQAFFFSLFLFHVTVETDLQAGSNHGYEVKEIETKKKQTYNLNQKKLASDVVNWCCQLLWVVLIGLIFALIIQSLAANLGVITGRINTKKSSRTKLTLLVMFVVRKTSFRAMQGRVPKICQVLFMVVS